MKTFKSIDEARAYANDKSAISHILEIEPGAPGIWPYVCCKCNAATLRSALTHQPNLIPDIKSVIRDAVDLQAEREAAQAAIDKADLEQAITQGIAFRSAEIADQYGGMLSWARRLDDAEKMKYKEWFRGLCMVSFPGSDHVEVEVEAIRRVVGNRHPDGQFNGCTNHAWTITAREWDLIIKLTGEVKERKAKAHADFITAEEADIQQKINTGYCFFCESWCHGDCGHYSNDPHVKLRRDFALSQKEANYGINDA